MLQLEELEWPLKAKHAENTTTLSSEVMRLPESQRRKKIIDMWETDERGIS